MNAELNTERLIRVRDLISATPALLNMAEDFVNGVFDDAGALVGHSFCISGLAALDAGWITLRSTPRVGTARVLYDVMPVAERPYRDDGALNLFRAAIGADADRLMFVANWPTGFAKQFEATAGQARATVAARRIDVFISTGGRT